MPVHSVILINITGSVVFSKYFAVHDEQRHLFFEQQLHRLTAKAWGNRLLSSPQTVTIDDVHIILKRVGELLLFVGGRDEVDEVISLELVEALSVVLGELVGGRVTEASLMTPDTYGKWQIAVEEAAAGGVLESSDPHLLLQMAQAR
eukprot:gene46367-56778_t